MILPSLSSFLFRVILLKAFLVDSSYAQETPSDFGIFDWIHNSPGGYFNPKQEFRYEIPGDSSTSAGIYATRDIRKGEVLIKVPWSLLIKSDDPEEVGQMCCGTVEAVAKEMRLGAESEFAPYAQYLNAQPEGQLPSAWSEPAQALFREIIGGPSVQDNEIPPAEPTEWLEWDWYRICDGDRSDKLAAKAALLVVQRSDDAIMIPGYDMYNHRNGKRWLNTKTTTTMDEHHLTRASRDIKAGEQIYNSYNHCAECDSREREYGTGEILRDYGFIEPYPRQFHYMDGDYEFVIDEKLNNDDASSSLVFRWYQDGTRPDDNDYQQFLAYMNRQIRRLRGIRNRSKFKPDLAKASKHEIETLWEFLEANIVAMNMAIGATEKEFDKKKKSGTDATETSVEKGDGGVGEMVQVDVDGTCSNEAVAVNGSHYDPLGPEFDDLDYSAPSCDNKEIMDFEMYNAVEEMKTNYQQLNFAINPDNGDLCMDIEDIIQICSCYRPQYHEYVVHAAARFVDSVKRVIFIGGGDSMILHEVMKYPNLELVVGLELDQTVVRKSFKHFYTQPHFDDDRVEWWFGDATKSLLLLPKDYWRSFDLVLIDLSETVMSLSVTEELDVFDALGLLLHPDGVMVKNELYFEKFNEVFDYTHQIYYESPIICSQALVMGSNSVDFLTFKPKDHGVETLLYEPMVTKDNHLDFMHDYSKNDARAQGKCGNLKIPSLPTEQRKAAGITAIVNAEKTNTPLKDGPAIVEKISAAITSQGFSLLSAPVLSNDSIYGAMKEGYIVARLWPDKNYCALDINLWGKFDQLDSLQAALTETLGSKEVSSYRVVVGGMFGASTWAEDQAKIGPQIVQTRNCAEPPLPTDTATTPDEIIEVALKESLNLALKTKLKSVVFCGVEGKGDCLAAELLGEYDEVQSVDQIFTCPGLDDNDVSNEAVYECEVKTLESLKSLVGTSVKSKLSLLVVDATVPYPFMQVLHSILGTTKDRKSLIRKQNMFVTLSTNPGDEEWRQQFLDRYRKQHLIDPVTRSYVLLKSGKHSVGFGLVSCGDEEIAYNLEAYQFKLQQNFDRMEKDIKVEVQNFVGGEFPFMDDFEPNNFEQSDYDSEPGLVQFKQQEFLGRQHIFQFVPAADVDHLNMSGTKLKETLEWGIEKLRWEIQNHFDFSDVGDGYVHIIVCKEGSVIGVWDGRDHVDVSLFAYEDLLPAPDDYVGAVLSFLDGTAQSALRDDQPRGIGRVINFPSDYMPTRETEETSEL